MNTEELMRRSMNDLADALPASADLGPKARAAVGRRRHVRQAVLAAVAVAVVAGSVPLVVGGADRAPRGVVPGASPSAVPAPPRITARYRVSGLVGRWGAKGPAVHGSAVLRLDASGFTVSRDCGKLGGEWLGSVDGQFTARITSWNCPFDPAELNWLTGAVGFRQERGGWSLVTRDGGVTRLFPMATLDGTTRSGDEAPQLRADIAAKLDRVLPALPAGVRPVTAEQLLGTWAPSATTQNSIEFQANGRLRGNGFWLLDDWGGVLAGTGPTFVEGCAVWPGGTGDECVSLYQWFSGTRVAYQDGDLVLYDGRGTVVHRLVRR